MIDNIFLLYLGFMLLAVLFVHMIAVIKNQAIRIAMFVILSIDIIAMLVMLYIMLLDLS